MVSDVKITAQKNPNKITKQVGHNIKGAHKKTQVLLVSLLLSTGLDMINVSLLPCLMPVFPNHKAILYRVAYQSIVLDLLLRKQKHDALFISNN